MAAKRESTNNTAVAAFISEVMVRDTLYMDRVDPLSNPLEHLLVDAPEHLAGTTAAFIVVRRLGTTVYDMYKKEGKSTKDAAIAAVLAGYVAGSAIDNLVFKTVTSSLEKKRSE